MARKLQKWIVNTMVLVVVMVTVTSSALAAVKGGEAIDILIPRFEAILTETTDVFPSNSYSISEESLLGKGGTVFIDFDEAEVRMIGEDYYRTYAFESNEDVSFIAFVGIVLYGIDTSSALDYGVSVYYIEDNDTEVMSEKEISTLAAQFVSALY